MLCATHIHIVHASIAMERQFPGPLNIGNWQGANAERSEATSLSSNAATSSTNSCSQNQHQNMRGRGDAEVILLDTSTTSADVPAEVMATDHVHNLHDDTMTPAHVQHNISDR